MQIHPHTMQHTHAHECKHPLRGNEQARPGLQQRRNRKQHAMRKEAWAKALQEKGQSKERQTETKHLGPLQGTKQLAPLSSKRTRSETTPPRQRAWAKGVAVGEQHEHTQKGRDSCKRPSHNKPPDQANRVKGGSGDGTADGQTHQHN